MSKRYWLLAVLCFCLVIGTVNDSTLLPYSQGSTTQTAIAQMNEHQTMKTKQDESVELFPFQKYGDSGKSGYIDKTGKEVIKLGAPFYFPRPFSEGLAAVTVLDKDKDGEDRGKIGYIDKTGQLVIKPQFEESDDAESAEAKNFSEGLAAVVETDQDGYSKYGYINKIGKVVIPFQYGEVRPFSEGFALVSTHKEGSWQQSVFIDRKGKRLFEHPQLYEARDFSEGLASVKIDSAWGFIDTTGKIVIKPQFFSAGGFSEGLAPVSVQVGNYLTGECQSGDFGIRSGYIDRAGNFIIKPQFSDAESFSEGLAAVQVGNYPDRKWGYIDKTGKLVIQPQFDDLVSPDRRFQEGLAPASIKNPKPGRNALVGFIGRTGAWVIKPQFDWADAFVNGLSQITVYEYTEGADFPISSARDGYVDKAGNFVWENKYR